MFKVGDTVYSVTECDKIVQGTIKGVKSHHTYYVYTVNVNGTTYYQFSDEIFLTPETAFYWARNRLLCDIANKKDAVVDAEERLAKFDTEYMTKSC